MKQPLLTYDLGKSLYMRICNGELNSIDLDNEEYAALMVYRLKTEEKKERNVKSLWKTYEKH
jgi:hypothetical protein